MRASRRLRTATIGGLAALALVAGACGSSEAEPDRAEPVAAADPDDPNFVFVLLDDLDETTSPYWDALPRTRALLADQGLTFTNAFATDPVCCPARATLLTGNYPHNTGIFDASPPDGGFTVFADGAESDTVATRLRGDGYTTAFVGKYLNGYEEPPHQSHVPPGWDEWFGLTDSFYDGYGYRANHNGAIETFGDDPEDYQTDVLSDRSVEFLEDTEDDDERPFLLYLSPSAPHAPIGPAPRHEDNPFVDDLLPTRPNFDEADVSDKPTWIRDGRPLFGAEGLEMLTARHRERMGSLLAVDEMVETVVDTLDANGELDDTFIVFISDNGYNLGAHRLDHKQVPYEESIRVPLVVVGPGVGAGVDDRLVAHIDMVPTLLDLAGLPADDLDGRSLAPLLAGDDVPWRTDFLIEFHGTYGGGASLDTLFEVEAVVNRTGVVKFVPTYRAVRTGQHLYVEWYRGDRHDYELYDLATDPYQLDNLLTAPGGAERHAALTEALRSRLEVLATCSGATCRT